jgi:hypothetical protein
MLSWNVVYLKGYFNDIQKITFESQNHPRGDMAEAISLVNIQQQNYAISLICAKGRNKN